MSPILLFVFGAILVIILGIFSAQQKAKRKAELQSWASSKGLNFDPGQYREGELHIPVFACMREGSDRYAFNVMSGDWSGRRFCGFDYHYETHSHDSKGRKQTHHHYFSAAVLSSAVPLKPLFIRPEGFFDKIGEFVGFDDIDFESAEFSRNFFVKAEDRRWAYDVLHQRAMEFLLESPRFTIQFDRNHAIIYKGSTFSVPEFDASANVVCGLLDQMPEYLVKQQTEGV